MFRRKALLKRHSGSDLKNMTVIKKVVILLPCVLGFVARVPHGRSSQLHATSPIDTVGDLLEQFAAPPAEETLPKDPLGVVITGGANGVGYAYASEFLKRGHRVMICDVKDPTEAVASLAGEGKAIFGKSCDVSDAASVRELAADATKKLGTVDIWINNAGINGGRRPFVEVPDEAIEAVVKVNLFGALICTKVAMELMMKQKKGGNIYNTVGSGVRGGGTPGYVTYGATKRGLPQLTDSLVAEIDGKTQGYDWKGGNVKVHTLSPGMVFTDLLLKDSTAELRKFPFSVLAATPEEVAADLVPKILVEKKTGAFVEYLSTPRTLVKFFNRFIRRTTSDIIDENGNVIRQEGVKYNEDGVRMLY